MKFAKMVPAHILENTLKRFSHLLAEVEDSEFAYIHDGVTEMILDDARAELENSSDLSEAVKRLEHEHEKALDLLGEIIVTLTLEHNAAMFADFPDVWHDSVKAWRRRWRYLRADVLNESNDDTNEDLDRCPHCGRRGGQCSH